MESHKIDSKMTKLGQYADEKKSTQIFENVEKKKPSTITEIQLNCSLFYVQQNRK